MSRSQVVRGMVVILVCSAATAASSHSLAGGLAIGLLSSGILALLLAIRQLGRWTRRDA
ncbi:MAG: hypothetical protein P4L84_18900 [Isosphaeraceae bacterium]|nr:hypothetical protein [Isosphaeraceae bacterium]